MKTLGNIIWFILFGMWEMVAYAVLGAVLCCTILFIPIGVRFFKAIPLVLWPFGKSVEASFDEHPVANILFLLLGGFEISAAYALSGVVFCCTLILIPFGLQCFKLASYFFRPFGAEFDAD